MAYYGVISGYEVKRTHSDGWVEFQNPGDKPGELCVHGHNMGIRRLSDGKTYSFTIDYD